MLNPILQKMITTRTPVACAGFSLVEMMIAMTLGIILMAGIASVVANSSNSHRELDKNSRQLENGRYAVQALRDDIRHAGFFGEFYDLGVPTATPSPCATATADLLNGIELSVQGYAGAASAPLACLPDYAANTDVLAIRRASTAVTPVASLQAADIYMQTRPDRIVLDSGTDSTVFDLTKRDGVTLAEIRKYLVHIYYIRSCSDCSGSGDGIPTLVRVELDAGNLNTVSPIAEGIENMQFRYGIDDTDNGAPDRFVTLPASLTEWTNVVTVDASILARNLEPTTGHTDSKSYTLGDVDISAPGDSFKRHVFTALARVVNTSARREN
jgi:type IV pilus assembly protein PilW